MPSITEMLVGQALDTASKPFKNGEGYELGIAMAANIEKMKQGRAELEQRKQEHELAKYDKVGSMFDTAAKMPEGPAKKAFMKEYVPRAISALGLEDRFDPVVKDMLLGDPKVASFIVGEIRNGKLDHSILTDADALAQAATRMNIDKQVLADTVQSFPEQISEAQKWKLEEDNKTKNAGLAARAVVDRQDKSREFEAGQADKTNAEAYGKKLIELGIPGIKTTMSKIDKEFVPGGLSKYDGKSQIPGIGGEQSLLPIGRLNAQGRRNRQLIQDVANDYIKMQTGAGVGVDEAIRLASAMGIDMAPTEGGGVRILLNGQRSSADMINGLTNLRDKVKENENTLKAGAGPGAIKYFEQNMKQLSGIKSYKDFSPAQKAKAIEGYVKKYGGTPEKAREILEKN